MSANFGLVLPLSWHHHIMSVKVGVTDLEGDLEGERRQSARSSVTQNGSVRGIVVGWLLLGFPPTHAHTETNTEADRLAESVTSRICFCDRK